MFAFQVGGAAGGYDKAGNLLNFGSVSVTYDGENRQVTAGSNGYYYDGFGQRIGRMAAGVPTVYVYDAFGLLASEYSTAALTYACTTCYLAGDHLGSTRLVTDANSNVVARHDYAPFGQEILAGVGGRVSPWGASDFVNQKFTGQERDAETNLDFFQARYLASGLGRFMSPDPGNAGADFTNPQSWNGYGYVLGNPLGWVDPSGRDTCSDGTYASVCVSAAADPVDVSNADWWNGLNWAYDPYSPLFTVTHTEKVTTTVAPAPANTGTKQTFSKCLAAHANDFSIAGALNHTYNAITGSNSLAFQNNFLAQAVLGNPITTFVYGSATDNAGTAASLAPTIVQMGMGTATSYGRRTTAIMALNLAGKGGVPLALGAASAGTKAAIGRVASVAGGFISLEVSLAVNVGLTAAEAAYCAGQP